MIIEASADMERLPSDVEEIKAGTSSQKLFPVNACIPRDTGPIESLLLCVGGDPTWRWLCVISSSAFAVRVKLGWPLKRTVAA